MNAATILDMPIIRSNRDAIQLGSVIVDGDDRESRSLRAAYNHSSVRNPRMTKLVAELERIVAKDIDLAIPADMNAAEYRRWLWAGICANVLTSTLRGYVESLGDALANTGSLTRSADAHAVVLFNALKYIASN
jgi:hypothetical protein